jgi:MFS family permease
MSTSLVPAYLNEISPASLRGSTGVIHQLSITFGILVSQLLGFRQLLGTAHSWPYLLGIPLFPSLLSIVLMLFFCPESPKELLLNKKEEEAARNVLMKLRNNSNVSYEIEEMTREARESTTDENLSLIELLKSSEYRMPLVTGIIMQIGQQLCGINAVSYLG